MPDKSIDEVNIDEFDSLLLPGATDIRSAIEDDKVLEFIKKISRKNNWCNIYCSDSAVKSVCLVGKPFMSVNAIELFEEGFTKEDLVGMIGWG